MRRVLNRAKYQWQYAITGILATLLVFTGVRFTPLWKVMAGYLDVGVSPVPADFIVVLDGHTGRPTRAAELYADGYAPEVITGIVSIKANREMAETLTANGVPLDAITPNCCGTSTWEEAQAHLQMLTNLGAERAMVVTNWPHTRRTKAIYEYLLELHELDIEVVVVSAPYEANGFARDQFVLSEYGKLLYYRLRYGVRFR